MTNLMFGPNAPRLMRMIVQEVKQEQDVQAGLKERVTRAITDISPEEKTRFAELEELHGVFILLTIYKYVDFCSIEDNFF